MNPTTYDEVTPPTDSRKAPLVFPSLAPETSTPPMPPDSYLLPPNPDVAVARGHGGAGATRIATTMQLFNAELVVIETSAVLAIPTILVVRATSDGAMIALNLVDSPDRPADLLIAAVCDGFVPNRVALSARRIFKSFASVVPTVVVPFVPQWREDATASPTKAYIKAIETIINQIQIKETK